MTNHMHGLNFMHLVYFIMSTCAREAAIVLPYRCALVLTGAKGKKKRLIIDGSVKMP